MAKSKKSKQFAPNIAFIERIEIQIKEKSRQRMLKRAPKPAGQQSTDILNQQYLLQRTLAQRIQPQPQQQSQTVNVYLGDVAKLQQQETLKRIDDDAAAAIIRTERGGINQERLDAVLSSLTQQRQEVKKQQPPPQSFDYGFIEGGAAQYREEVRAQSVAALERLNKANGPRAVAFEAMTMLQPRAATTAESSRRRALTPEQRRAISVEASERASALSKMTAQQFVEKHPDITGEILRESQQVAKSKYRKRRAEIEADVQAGRLTMGDGEALLRDFSTGIGLDIKPRLKERQQPLPVVGLTPSQEQQFPKTAAVLKKKSQTTAADLSGAIAANVRPTILSEQVPAAAGGGQSAEIQAAKTAGKTSARQRAAKLVEAGQPTILQSFGRAATAGEDLAREVGASSPIEATPPSSRPTTAGSRPRTGESFTRPGVEVVASGTLPKLSN